VFKKVKKSNLNSDLIPQLLIAFVLSSLNLAYSFGSILLSLFLAYVFIVNGLIKKKKFTFNKSLLLPVLLYLWLASTYFWSVDTNLTLKGIFRLLPIILVPISFGFIKKFEFKETFKILDIFTIFNGFFAVIFLYNATLRYLDSGLFCEYTYHDLLYEFDLNAIYVSAYFSISLLFLMSVKRKSIFSIFLMLFICTVLLLLSSKTIIVSTALCVIFYIPTYIKRARLQKKQVVILFVISILILIPSSQEIYKRFNEELKTNITEVLNREKFNKVYPWTGSSIRILQLRILKEQITEDSIFLKGYGLFASRGNLEKRHKDFNTYHGYHDYNYHNQYAQILSESGIIGLLVLIFLLINSLITAVRSKSFLFTSFCVLMVLWFSTESVLWVQRGIIFFILLYCLFSHTEYKNTQSEANQLKF
jgi:O-antigen ligase